MTGLEVLVGLVLAAGGGVVTYGLFRAARMLRR